MGFFDEDKSRGSGGGKKYRSWRDTFLFVEVGKPVTVRIIEPNATENVVWKHYIPKARTAAGKYGLTVPCPGINVCPICKRNAELGDKEHKDYIKAFPKYVVNVLVESNKRVCPLCELENEGLKCSFDDTDLSEVEPVGHEVKLLEGSRTFFKNLDTIEQTITAPYSPERVSMFNSHGDAEVEQAFATGDPPEVPVGLTAMPIRLSATKAEKGVDITPVYLGAYDNFDYTEYEDQYISLEDAYLKLTEDELNALVAGGSLVELLKARRSTPADEDTEDAL